MTKKNNNENMRIYIGNKEIAGYFARLKDGFDKIGVKADLWYLIDNKYYTTKTNKLVKLNQRLFPYFKKNLFTIFFPFALMAAFSMVIIHSLVFVYALFKYDVFILNSQPFFNYTELAILKLFRKKIIVAFLGTESRPEYISGNLIQGKYSNNGNYNLKSCYKNVKAQHQRIQRIEKYADFIINHPPTALFQQKPFIAWLHVGFPNDIPVSMEKDKNDFSRIVKVLHAPSNAVSKGTTQIIEIIDQLRKEGLPIEFMKLENVPNEKVMDEIRKCDLVVDELYSDIPIGGLGTEAAFARKPVINGGYYAPGINTDYPADVIPPACFCLPENLNFEIKEFTLNKQKRDEYAQKLNKFVTEKWDSETVAKKYMEIISGNIPNEWIYDPKNIKYFMGYGIEKNKLRSFLKQYVSEFGEKSLFLEDKPGLKTDIMNFIQSTPD
jgi:glycosyltransferase involved in cell wall biosynthesis